MFCSSCGLSTPQDARVCPSCGAALNVHSLRLSQSPTQPAHITNDVTRPDRSSAAARAAQATGTSTSSTGWLSSSDSIDHGRFPPGALLDGRYRIIGIIGKGGMGEVYRADDLRLGQAVALKFLPDALRNDPLRLAQFHNEVRLARQVSHPNVCRVYDVGEAEGHLYLSMEYVDGEDLATSLRRIGRFPDDKAAEISRQLCAGLAAAHDRGVLHRDLKPANVMLDGNGRVRLMDFGLAAVGRVEDVRAGTPAYMAPEQLLGRDVTARSDIFSLGLVIYELFTGRRAFTAGTMQELVTQHQSSAVTPPASIVSGLDPSVERAIMRCLTPEPERRPSSALAVSAALPGGDPLAAALAAGETPSPELLAAAGESVRLSRRAAIAWYAAALVGLLAVSVLTLRTSTLDTIRPEFPPEVMAQKARDILTTIGYTERARDDAYAYAWDDPAIDYVARNPSAGLAWRDLLTGRAAPLSFWYRRSQAPLTGLMFHNDLLTPGIVDAEDPPPILAGMIMLRLDQRGRLMFFEAIPPQVQDTPEAARPIDWNPLFSLAGLDTSALQAAAPHWNGLAAADTRAAWTGTWPGTTLPLRVEAAAYAGKPVGFMLVAPWQPPWRMPDSSDDDTIPLMILGCFAMVILVAAVVMARLNLREGRGDRRSALTLAYFTMGLMLALWAFDVHAVASLGLLGTFFIAIATAVFNGVLLWTIYIALEPLVRRRWPQALVSWTTLFSGRVKDPVVGRDVLVGVLLGTAWVLILRGIDLSTGAPPAAIAVEFLDGVRSTLGALAEVAARALRTALFFFLLLFVWRVLLRKQWAAALAFALTFAALDGLGGERALVAASQSFAVSIIAAIVVVRWGLVSLTVGVLVTNLLLRLPVSGDLSAWYTGNALLLLLMVVVLTTWAFMTSVGTRKLGRA